MKYTGRALAGLLLSLLVFTAAPVYAELSASVDRDRVSMGDSLRLTVAATANELIGNLDYRPLLKDFEILQRSSSSNTSIVNGQKTSSRNIILEITPRRTGTLRIPSLRAGGASTNYLIVSVSPPANGVATDQTVSFEAELDQASVYVQGQVLLTLRIMQSINLESRSVTELQLDNAFVKQLEQQSFQRTINGRPWLIHEIRYAIFPEESGVLEIPAQTFSARESNGRRSMLGFGSSGRALNRTSNTLSLKVLPRPDSFPGTTWLPATKLELQESWSTPPEQLHTGESATRTVTIRGVGLQGAQLPPTVFPSTGGLRYYPDQPVISEIDSSTGLTGTRKDSAALIPTQEGRWTVPEVRIPWWDTKAGKIRYATLPEREIVVTTGVYMQLDSSPIAIVAPAGAVGPIDIVTATTAGNGLWKFATIVCALGWLCTFLYLLLSRRPLPRTQAENAENLSENKTYKQLMAACAANNAAVARRATMEWATTLFPHDAIHSLEEVAGHFQDAEMHDNLARLNNQLYSEGGGTTWDSAELTTIAQRLRKQHQVNTTLSDQTLTLYPSQT